MRIAWTTDLHLNFVDSARFDRLIEELRDSRPDVLLIGGDIGEADSFSGDLKRFADSLAVPVYFVLGNHDYYRGSIASVRRAAAALSRECPALTWLADSDAVRLTEKTALVGHGGWGDARAGNFRESDVLLNDYLLIEELLRANRAGSTERNSLFSNTLCETLQHLGDEAAASLRRVLRPAIEDCDHVVVLMHVPPFLESCWHEGKLSDQNWAPHFTCVAAGEVLIEIAERNPQKRLTVLCGHTHSSGHATIRENLEVFTGDAEYGDPKLQKLLELT